ncbi:MAG: 5-oxoprolinase subunit PxpB, partial [Syntrophobacteraceae bacterium]
MTGGLPEVRMLSAGERGLVVEMGNLISPQVNARVRRLARRINQKSIAGVIEVVPTYRSLLVYFDPFNMSRSDLIEAIQQMLASEEGLEAAEKERVRVVHVPVCYGGEFGPDLDHVAQHNGLSIEEVITIHSSKPYLVYMLGFTPGFPYLGGMSEKIATPRLEKPRSKIPQGSVGIAGAQTGLYPIESPGGWRLIGRTPLNPFVPDAANPFLFAAGDYLRFVPISPEEYHHIRRDVETGLFTP